jgi:hypothetical protein
VTVKSKKEKTIDTTRSRIGNCRFPGVHIGARLSYITAKQPGEQVRSQLQSDVLTITLCCLEVDQKVKNKDVKDKKHMYV